MNIEEAKEVSRLSDLYGIYVNASNGILGGYEDEYQIYYNKTKVCDIPKDLMDIIKKYFHDKASEIKKKIELI